MAVLRRKGDYYTPSELIEKYPEVEEVGWTPVKIGMFLNAGLLRGYYASSEKRNVIEEQSFTKLIDYFNELNSLNNNTKQIFVKKKD